MKNNKIIVMLIWGMIFHFQSISQNTSAIYQIKCNGLDTGQIKMSNYQGKKIMVYVFDAANPNKKLLMGLDSVYRKYSFKLMVIAIPALDLGTNASNGKLKKFFKDSVNLSFAVTELCKVKKNGSSSSQNQLMNYLTNKTTNEHFDDDITKAGEIFFLSEKGKLFGRFSEVIEFNSPFMVKLINRRVD